MADAIPKTAADIVELTRYWIKRDGAKKDPDILVSYLIYECGLRRLLIRKALWNEWREAAELVQLTSAERVRECMMLLLYRTTVIEYLDGCVKLYHSPLDSNEGITQQQADQMLVEWDTLHTPEQVPAPQRVAAIGRLRRHGVEL